MKSVELDGQIFNTSKLGQINKIDQFVKIYLKQTPKNIFKNTPKKFPHNSQTIRHRNSLKITVKKEHAQQLWVLQKTIGPA